MHRLRYALLATGAAVGFGGAVVFANEQHGALKRERPAIPADPYCLLLAGDCGGTNTRLSLYSIPLHARAEAGHRAPGELVADQKYRNSEFKDIVEIVQRFMLDHNVSVYPAAACFACAGPIVDNSVNFTNNHWEIDGGLLQKRLGIQRVELINDFVAQGYGLLTVADSECTVINDAPVVPGAPIACIGAGTGLGECYLTPNGGTYTCHASEGGHAEFHPRDALEVELLQFLQNRYQQKHRISIERVVSGPGIAALYEFLRQHRDFQDLVDPAIDQRFNAAGDLQGAVIAENAEANAVCRRAVDIFVAHYGAEAGVAALKWLPKAGLYLSGGIGAKNPHWITSERFKAALYDKGRLTPAVRSVPIKLVNTEDVGERGAHWAGFHILDALRLQH